MAQLIQPGSVKIVTKDGEITVKIEIDLNINLHQNGSTIIDGSSNIKDAVNIPVNKQNKQDDDAAWMIPDFKSAEKIKFGK